jgi:RNA polymerase sigma factor (sigma-70 family)
MALTDETLMQQFQGGDRSAFAALVARHREHALHFCRRMIHDPHMAEDLAQEAFARILLHPERWSGRGAFTGYLFSTLKNLCIDEIRWRARWRGSAEAPLPDLPDPAPLPEEKAALSEQARQVRAALEHLSPDHKAALIMRAFHGLPYDQIARAMDWSEAKTKVTIYRARLALGRAFTAIEGGVRHAARR